MSDKRKKRKFQAKREARHLKRIADAGPLINDVKIPLGSVPADVSQQVPNNSYDPPPKFYTNKEFICIDCGSEELWTAQQQKWYYEIAKGPLFATAVRCRDCRRKCAQQEKQGDPNPIKHVGSLMKRIRDDLEPELVRAGFEFDGKKWGKGSRLAWLDYSRPGLILRCRYEPCEARIISETVDDRGEYKIVANIEMNCPRTSSELLERIHDFESAVRKYLQTLPVVTDLQERSNT